jgi:hypothetical protein
MPDMRRHVRENTETGTLEDEEQETAANHRVGAPLEHAPVGQVPEQVRAIVEEWKQICGANLVAVIFFGSWLLRTSPDAHSAADLFVVVEDYGQFYRALRRQHKLRRRARFMTLLNRILPPNVISFAVEGQGARAKCFVINQPDFNRSLSKYAPDHFCRGRLSQSVRVVHTRDAEATHHAERWLETARQNSLEWVPLYVGSPFGVRDYCLRMLAVSFENEFRPEPGDRVLDLFASQEDYLLRTYGRILEAATAAGRIERMQGGYRTSAPTSLGLRLRWRWYFWRSRLRATLRWMKYVLTFDDWLDYILHKIERRTGMRVEVTPNERRLPFLLLWPKALRVLLALRSVRKTKGRENDVTSAENGLAP